MLSDDLAALFVGASLGVLTPEASRTIFTSPRSVVPDSTTKNFIIIIDTAGSGPENTHNAVSSPAYLRPSAQITVLGHNVESVKTLILALHNVVYPVRNQTVNSVWYRRINILQTPYPLGVDDKNRARWVFNVNATHRPA